MLRQALAFARPRHRVPLIAYAAGVERKRKARRGRLARWRLHRDQSGLAVGRKVAPIVKHAFGTRAADWPWPLERREVIVFGGAKQRARADVEIARAVVLERGQCGVLGKISFGSE